MRLSISGLFGGTALLLSFVALQELNAANPAEVETIGRIVRERDGLSSLQAIPEKPKPGSDLSQNRDGRSTLFAPTNEAFKKLPGGAIKTLPAPQNNERTAPREIFLNPRS